MALKTVLNRPNSIVNDAWLGLGDLNGVEIENPLLNRPIEYIENPGLLEIKLMRDPNYLSFASKTLLDVDLLPVQSMIMEELWWRPFPMYIASRGAGKAQRTSELILTPNGWIKNGDLKIGDEVYDRYGNVVKVVGIFPQGKKRVCRLTLLDGRSIDCCEDHMWTVFNQGKEKVVSTKKIIESGIKYTSGVYKYKIPNCEPIPYSKKDLPLDPYILGCLLGDGCLTTITPKIASNDEFIIEQFRNTLDGFELKKDTTNNNYTIVDRNKPFTERISKSGKKYYSRHKNRLTLIIRELGLNVGCKDKFIPEIYKYSSIEDRMELIRGLFDTDGSINKLGAIEFTNTCEQLIDDVLEVLRSLGITCKKAIDDRSDQLMTLPQGTVINRTPYFRIFVNTSKPVFKLPRKLNRIKKKATNAEKYVSIVDAKYTDEYDDMQCIAVDSPDHTYITKDYIVTHNSFLLAVYCTLKCALIPNTKIVTVGAAFRQSKVIFEYMDSIWNNAPVLRSVCTNTSGPRSGIDRCVMRINDSRAIFIPLGDGSKIRGLRAHSIIADEFACVGWDTLVETDSGLKRIRDCFDENSIQVLNRYGNYEKPQKYIKTPKTDVYKITTAFGFSFRCSEIHKVFTENGWKIAKDLTNDDYLVLHNKYKFPNRAIVSIESALNLGIDGKFDRVPNCILQSNRDVVVAFLSGLFKTYGIVEHGSFIYHLPSEDLASEVHVLLWKAGYLSSLAGKVITIHFGDEYRFFTEILCRREMCGIHNRELVVRVSSVEKLDAQEHLYDFFLPHTNSFYGNGFVQHNSIPPDIYETVVRGFAAVSAKPVDNVKEYARRQAMINMGTWSDRAEKNFTNRVGNQCIIAGTADYDFMHYADYWKRYIVSIRSGGDPDKPVKLPSGETKTLREYYPDGVPESFSSEDYSVIRIPYELVPKGFMDDKVVSAAKSSSHRAIYLKEYAACAKPDTLIITDTGCKPIQDIRVGDMVLTHKGRFRPVTKCTYRRVKEEIPHIRCLGYNKYIGMTKNHPWFDGEKFIECDAADKAVFPNLSELSEQTFDEEYGKVDYHLGAQLARNRVVFPAKLLYSNEEFLDSVLDEYFNDSDTFTHTNLDLCIQLKLCLSYFDMMSSITEHEGKYTISLMRDMKSIPLNHGNYYVIQDKYYEYYDGFVYNLEVEEDNSYCTLAGAVHNCFPSDSDGFFKRSLIQKCVTSDTNPIELPSGPVWFDAMISGNPGFKYVYGVDPAAERDNFSVVILELHDDHTRIVYCWSTNIHDFERRKKAGMAEENDYYGFCARKIRNLMKVFPTEDIAIDAQGGGRAILEAFHDPNKLQTGEVFLWPTNRILDPDKELPTDDEPGLHICHMCQFANFDFISGANHGTRKDFEDRVLLFPRFDPVTLELAAHADAQLSKKLGVKQLYDTLEDCVMEIEELKDELCTIVMTRTGTGVNGRDRWDTPETVTAEGKKTRMRKDRYSALIMANYIARSIQRAPAPVQYNVIGGFAHQMAARERKDQIDNQGYQGPEWFTKAAESFTTVNKIVHRTE